MKQSNKTQEALKFYADPKNWQSPSKGFALQYDPELSPIEKDRGKLAKEALAQPAQEPVAWNEEEFNAIAYAYRTCPAHEIKMVSDRYQELVNYVLSITHPAPAWQGLSADEIIDMYFQASISPQPHQSIINFIRAIEQALKEKNAI